MAASQGTEDWQVLEVRGNAASAWCYNYTQDAHYSPKPTEILLSPGQRSQHRSWRNEIGDKRSSRDSLNFKADFVHNTSTENRVHSRDVIGGDVGNTSHGGDHHTGKALQIIRDTNGNYDHFRSANVEDPDSKDLEAQTPRNFGVVSSQRNQCEFRPVNCDSESIQRLNSKTAQLQDSGVDTGCTIETDKQEQVSKSAVRLRRAKLSLDSGIECEYTSPTVYDRQGTKPDETTERSGKAKVQLEREVDWRNATSYSKPHKLSPENRYRSSKGSVGIDSVDTAQQDIQQIKPVSTESSGRTKVSVDRGILCSYSTFDVEEVRNQSYNSAGNRRKISPDHRVELEFTTEYKSEYNTSNTSQISGETKLSCDSGIESEGSKHFENDVSQGDEHSKRKIALDLKLLLNRDQDTHKLSDTKATSKQTANLSGIKQKQLDLIDRRKAELQDMIDRWHSHLTRQVEDTYAEEEERQFRTDRSDTDDELVMSSILSVEDTMLPKHFGSFKVHHVLRKHMPALAADYWAYQLGPARHLRTFETRESCDLLQQHFYMASSLVLTPGGDILVADLGADTCRIFTHEGRLKQELDTYPFDEPTHAICHGGGYLLCCREGLKRFSIQGKYADTIQDIKCPQSVAMDTKRGNLIVSDMHDCGTVIVTLHRDTLKPLRFICGSEYENEAVFRQAWHILVTVDNTLLLTDRYDHTLKAYRLDGTFLWSVGGQGSKPGQLFNPAGISEDFLGNILVADSNNDRVQMWGADGQWLGVLLNESQISQPMDLATDEQGNLYVLQGDGKVVIYRYLRDL